MRAKPSKDNKDLSSRSDLALLPDGTTLTDSVSIGRSGREWHLPIEAKLNRQNASPRCSAAQVTTYYGADTIVRLTCEFLRKHAPESYTKLYAELQNLFPTQSEFPEACRDARDGIRPFKQPGYFEQTLQTPTDAFCADVLPASITKHADFDTKLSFSGSVTAFNGTAGARTWC
jgi:hypothetical protein